MKQIPNIQGKSLPETLEKMLNELVIEMYEINYYAEISSAYYRRKLNLIQQFFNITSVFFDDIKRKEIQKLLSMANFLINKTFRINGFDGDQVETYLPQNKVKLDFCLDKSYQELLFLIKQLQIQQQDNRF
jgi:hypothetical protein